MQPDNPYRLIEALGSSQVGSVWSAVDAEGRPLTVAVLDASVALDRQWRDAFAAATNGLAQPQAGGPRVLYTDFDAPSPWVACAADGGSGAEQVFLALGVTYQPVPLDPGEDGPPATPALDAPEQTQADATELITAPAEALVDGETTQPTEKIHVDPLTPVNPWAMPPSPISPPAQQPYVQQPYPQQPISTPPHAVSAPPQSISGPPRSTSGPPQAVSAPPQSISGPPDSISGAPHAMSGPPHAVSGPPQQLSLPPNVASSIPYSPMPHSPAYGPLPPDGPSQYPPYYPPHSAPPAAPPAPRRTGIWIGIGAVVLLLIVGAGTALALGGSDDGNEPQPPSATAPLPTSSPMFPGIEPPRAGAWPAAWPRFASTDRVRTFSDLEGLGFSVTVPDTWDCTPGGRAEGYARYNCGMPAGENPQIGGELVVRNCPAPCSQETQASMRRSEEAWGVQWVQASQSAAYAELGGAERYALVVVAYWRSENSGELDRQLVLRMTSPLANANQLHQVVISLRDTLRF